MDMKDIFISHAHEDKRDYVYPLVEELQNSAISYWLDEIEIGWGHTIIRKVGEGLISSKFVLVLLTNTFLEKKWTQIELETALTTEVNTGELVVLPVMVAMEEDVFRRFPLMRSKLFLRWDIGCVTIANRLLKLLDREFNETWTIHHPAEYVGKVWMKILKKRLNIEKAHRYTIRWGPWEFRGKVNRKDKHSETLVYSKGNDGLSIPIFVKISPACYLSFGQGEPPDGDPIDINHGWDRVE
jgi:hypothetical protein